MNLEIANKLLKLRKENNLSQEDLAEKLGVTRQAISKWERGESSPDTDNLIQLSNLYRVSLDELLGIDVTTYKSPSYPRSSSDMNAQTIRLTKPNDDGLNYIFSETSKRVVYPKGSLDEEIYPKGSTPPPTKDEPKPFNGYDGLESMSMPYKQSNPIVPTSKPSTNSKNKKRKTFVPPLTNNRFINKFEKLMAKHKVSYRGLYRFPCYAIAIALAVLINRIMPCYHGDYLMGASVLSIPLYYTFINAIQHRNPNRFGYPILALILVLISMAITDRDISALWLATIPFYYWYINKDK
jgi:HTH-type transcriptional regulator/antitoxin HipB